MTQEEYNALTDEEQNALVATEVLGWETFYDGDIDRSFWGKAVEDADGYHSIAFDFYCKDFDPKHNLDHAFMLVDKLEDEDFYWTMTKGITYLPYGFKLFKDIVFCKRYGKTKNEAILLACLKAKGVVE